MLDLALLNQLLNGSRHLFDRHLGVYTVLILQINGVNPQALQRALDRLA